MRYVIALLIIPILWSVVGMNSVGAQGTEPGWYPYTFARGLDRDRIRQTPMHLRPYRPLHFYGNMQRRTYYRGNAIPRLQNFRQSTRNLIGPSRLMRR